MNAPVSWCSKKQNVVALSLCKVEFIASVEAACQGLWLESVLEELKLNYRKPVQLLVDNKSTIDTSKNPISHGKSKQIETKYHFLRDQVMKKKIELMYCFTKEQVANIFTKPLKQSRFEKLRDLLELKSPDVLD